MARIQFGSIVTGISGKLGGHIFGNSVNGPTIRNLAASKKLWGYIGGGSHRGAQTAQVNVSLISQTWKDLTDAERSAWTSYAVQYYTTHSLYGAHSLTGYSCFSKLNHNILLVGGTIITIPVPKVTLSDPGIVGIQTLTTGSFLVAFSGSLTPDEYWLVSATGTNSVTLVAQKKGFKIIKSFSSSQATPLPIIAEYTDIKGAPLIGGWITVKVEIINRVTGQRGNAKSAVSVVS